MLPFFADLGITMAMTSMMMIFQDDDDNSQSVYNLPRDLMENNPIVCCTHP